MKKVKELLKELDLGRVAWGLLAGIVIIYAFSWIITCCVIKLVTILLGLEFSIAVATGIWLVMCIIRSMFKRK
jgi:hypothetical protein